MAELLTMDDILDRTDDPIDQGRAKVYIGDVRGQAYLAAPCLAYDLTDNQRLAAVGILAEAVLRRLRRDKNPHPDVQRETQQAGPFGRTLDYGPRDGAPLLTRGDRDQLAALCGTAGATAGSLKMSSG